MGNKEFRAVFSYHSAENKCYESVHVRVNAADRYIAREAAWYKLKEASQSIFCGDTVTDIKLCGVTWDGNRLDMQDYFDSWAESCKTDMNVYRNVEQLNRLRGYRETSAGTDTCRDSYIQAFGEFFMIDRIAADLYKPLGIVPPSISTDIHFAQKIADNLWREGNHDLAAKIEHMTYNASNWDENEIFVVRKLFEDKSVFHNGDYVSLDRFFAPDGCCQTATGWTYDGRALKVEATLAPFYWVDHDDESASVCLTVCRRDVETYKENVFSTQDRCGSGYDWAELAAQYIIEQMPELQSVISFDPEHSLYCAYSSDKDALMKFAQSLNEVCEDDELLSDLFMRAHERSELLEQNRPKTIGQLLQSGTTVNNAVFRSKASNGNPDLRQLCESNVLCELSIASLRGLDLDEWHDVLNASVDVYNLDYKVEFELRDIAEQRVADFTIMLKAYEAQGVVQDQKQSPVTQTM